MKVTFKLEKRDINAITDILRQNKDTDFVKRRIDKIKNPQISIEKFWNALVIGLFTTQQKSGPKSVVSRLIKDRPFKKMYNEKFKLDERIVKNILRDYPGIRFMDKLAHQLVNNRSILNKYWKEIKIQINKIITSRKNRPAEERILAERLQELFKGIGPKQSRNLLQSMGVARFEIPIDSRSMKWISLNMKFSLPINPQVLASEEYYCFVLSIFQKICNTINVFPAILDGCIFVSFDQKKAA